MLLTLLLCFLYIAVSLGFETEPSVTVAVDSSEFFEITYDGTSYMIDGGSNVYDYGNYIYVAGCHVNPYTDLWEERTTAECSSTTSTAEQNYSMRMHPESMYVYAHDLVADQVWHFDGHLGANGAGTSVVETEEYTTVWGDMTVYGFRKTVCDVNIPGVTHLWITNDPSISDWEPHSNSDYDDDRMTIHAGYFVLLSVYWTRSSSESSVCPITNEQHLAVFESLKFNSCQEPDQPGYIFDESGPVVNGTTCSSSCAEGYTGSGSTITCTVTPAGSSWSVATGCEKLDAHADPFEAKKTAPTEAPAAAPSNGNVLSHQKVSATHGGFTGSLAVSDEFGNSCASVGGDLNGDGVLDLVVGAYSDDDGGQATGAVYIVFMQTNGNVLSHQKVSATHGGFTGSLDNSDNFGGSSASVGGDLNGDGVLDLVVGAYGDGDGASGAGAVYILFFGGIFKCV